MFTSSLSPLRRRVAPDDMYRNGMPLKCSESTEVPAAINLFRKVVTGHKKSSIYVSMSGTKGTASTLTPANPSGPLKWPTVDLYINYRFFTHTLNSSRPFGSEKTTGFRSVRVCFLTSQREDVSGSIIGWLVCVTTARGRAKRLCPKLAALVPCSVLQVFVTNVLESLLLSQLFP